MNFISVSEFTNQIKTLLEDEFSTLWISGEVSRPKVYPSGHCYFTLKDSGASISCVIWQSYTENFDVLPKEGDKIAVYGKVSLYKQRGQYQFVVYDGMDIGRGNLFLELERLKKKYENAGYFDSEIKKSIPEFPKTIAIVTGETTAALRDVIRVFNSKKLDAKILIFDTPVQGEKNYSKVLSALENTVEYSRSVEKIDVTLLIRGGGSIEDLWLFNNEALIDYIHDYEIPIITGIGHEIDYTLCDFVSDYRAPTPSAAADKVAHASSNVINDIESMEIQLKKDVIAFLNSKNMEINSLQAVFSKNRIKQIVNYKIEDLDFLEEEFVFKTKRLLQDKKRALESLEIYFSELNPIKLQEKGYSILTDINNKLIKSVKKLEIGSEIKVVLHDGDLIGKVEQIEKRDI